ncbi:MAG: phosphate/phosphite/phosphonate ABC transporter substrate-binding protein, partial [Gammaproteobacteria bacterium]|nr:phosphate/phosphite/phosphonate ABC transporter substrate-binding protein [Gammaproteobacteria bacterium]
EDLAGKKACAPGSPNFGMLNLFNHFKDETKQPVHVEVKGWNNVYESVKNGDCVAGVLPKKNHQIYDKDGVYTRSIHTHLPYPNQAITASKRIPDGLRKKISSALLSEDGHKAMENLRKRYTGGSKLVSAVDEEYDSIHSLLIKAKSFTDNDHSKNDLTFKMVNN